MPAWTVFALPWVAFVLWVALRVRPPLELEPAGESPDGGSGAPAPVGVVVPARNEAHNIGRVLDTLTASDHPRFEVVVVDDESDDGTGDLARSHGPGRARRLAVVEGEPLPAGWLGKPWACAQGAREARGELLLFTDADTVHAPGLLRRAVRTLEREGADVLTVAGRQIMGSFWERLVQPQVFLTMALRYPDPRRPLPAARWRDAIASGQYLLFRRGAYEELGGHGAVRDEVAEDLRLAQIAVGAGMRLVLRRAEDELGTRMYRSLRETVAGWTKNVVPGGLQTLPPALRPVAPPAMVAAPVLFWLVPPAALAAAAAGAGPPGLLPWAASVVALSAGFWMAVSRRLGAPARYGILYPLGAGVLAWIVLRSWLGRRRVTWKGRSYGIGDDAGRSS